MGAKRNPVSRKESLQSHCSKRCLNTARIADTKTKTPIIKKQFGDTLSLNLVDCTGFEPVTPALSKQCSKPTELAVPPKLTIWGIGQYDNDCIYYGTTAIVSNNSLRKKSRSNLIPLIFTLPHCLTISLPNYLIVSLSHYLIVSFTSIFSTSPSTHTYPPL